MLSPSIHLRLFGLAAGASLVAAAVAYVRTDGAPAAKAPVVVSRPAPAPTPEPAAPEPATQAPVEVRAEPAPPPLAAAPPPSLPTAAEPPTGSIPAPPQAVPEVPPSARAALIGRTPRPARLDLNTASVAELNALHGAGRIGRRIVKHRPYRAPEDLLRKRVLSRSTYVRIKDQVRVGGE